MTESPEETREGRISVIANCQVDLSPEDYVPVIMAIEKYDAEAGMVLVPRSPTEDMKQAGLLASPWWRGNDSHINAWIVPIYKAMIKAYEESK